MIVIEMKLISAQGLGRDADLCTLVIDNITDNDKVVKYRGSKCDYRARMYRKNNLKKHVNSYSLVAHAKPIREGQVIDHARNAEPVGNLVAKALKALNYG